MTLSEPHSTITIDTGEYQSSKVTSKYQRKPSKLQFTTALMTLSAAMISNSSAAQQSTQLDHEDLYFFDAEDYGLPPRPGKVMHLSIDYQVIGDHVKGKRECFTSSTKVNAFLSDLDYRQLTGHSESFNTLACALTTVEKIQRVEALQPRLAWKPLEVIKKTLENTTQWGRTICQYPLKKHHVSRFPWDNRKRLQRGSSNGHHLHGKTGILWLYL